MKSFKGSRWAALVSVGLVAACGGVSHKGRGGDGGAADSKTGGSAGTSTGSNGGSGHGGSGGGGGLVSMAGMASGATASGGAAAGGAAAAGSAGSSVQSCMSSAECPGYKEPCQMCADGHSVCNDGICDGTTFKCKRGGGFCSTRCLQDADCPTVNLPCTDCGDGTSACAIGECKSGFCEVSYPGCEGSDPCEGRECGYDCTPCVNGDCSASVMSFCNDAGKCQPGAPACGQQKCRTATDCSTPPPGCTPCTDGSCATFDCVNDKCALSCPNSALKCKLASDCPDSLGEHCSMCPNGKCAVGACVQSACQLVCLFE